MFETIITSFYPLFFIIIGILPVLAATHWARFRRNDPYKKTPLVRDMLRPPGYSLSQIIAGFNNEIISSLIAIFCTPLIAYAAYVSQSHFLDQPDTPLRISILLITVILLLLGIGRRHASLLNERDKYQLGMEGEIATSQELDQLMLEGCRIFHDLPMEYGNIDHVVVHQSGVYSINTKTYSKDTRSKHAEVAIDHRSHEIHLPNRKLPINMKKFDTERRWLSNFLTSSVGKKIYVETLLALPGWTIKQQIAKSSVYVFNPKNCRSVFVHKKHLYNPQTVQQIAHQLDNVCRTYPRSFRPKRSWPQANGDL